MQNTTKESKENGICSSRSCVYNGQGGKLQGTQLISSDLDVSQARTRSSLSPTKQTILSVARHGEMSVLRMTRPPHWEKGQIRQINWRFLDQVVGMAGTTLPRIVRAPCVARPICQSFPLAGFFLSAARRSRWSTNYDQKQKHEPLVS